jgi:serine/threonine protein kinase/tetratricopeptide (TPR) repeat protein
MAEQPTSERSIFLTAMEKSRGAERAAYLEEACAGDAQLRADIEGLIAAHDRLPPSPAAAESDTFDPPILLSLPSTIIGRYKLLESIGEGAHGTVYMAEQTSPVQRKVALKIIKAGMDSKQVIARFEAERQALALMDHPNIAKVFDAGVTETGRPYFVMELVKGVTITKYCDEHRLTPRDRLELFVQVCQAVQHAHQKGIIHRDLKPSNVLVALYDGKPVPKVIDFGVAKATGQRLTEKTMFTGFGVVIGTPEYMSPEQAELNQLDIDTRSDIYSLGVLLYELLTGSPPFSHKELQKAGMLEMLRVIREREPTRPSTKLSTAEGLPMLAANRGTEAARLTKLVRGELDWIVMKALEKDRSRRYETANGLVMDVQRYLADEPVQACPPSAGYRLRKFLRRNKGPVVAGAAVLLTLIAGIIGTALGLRGAQKAWRAEAKRADGELQAKLAAQEREAETRAMLDLVERKIFAAARPQVDAKGLDYDRTLLKVLEEMLALRKATLGPGHPETRACEKSLALLYFDRGQRHCEAAQFRDAIEDIARAMELDPRDNLRWYKAAALYLYAGDIERYRAACREMLNRFEGEFADNPMTAERTAKTCALVADSVRDLSRAQKLAERSVTGTQRHAYYRQFILAKGLTDYRGGRPEQAVEWLKRFAPEAVGTDYDATAFAVLAMAQHRLGDAGQARTSLAFARAIIAEKSDDWLRGEFWNWMHAEILLREAEELMGAVSQDELAAARQLRWSRDLADPKPGHLAYHAPKLLLTDDTVTYRRICTGLIEKFRDTNDPYTAYFIARLCALAPDAVSDPAGPVELAERAVRADPSPYFLHTLGLAYYRAGQFDEAIEQLNKSIDGKWNANAANWLVLAMVQHRLGHGNEARKWFDQAARWMENPDALRSIDRRDSLACQVLRREAETLLGLRQGPEPKEKKESSGQE